jgi:hypothetical protein
MTAATHGRSRPVGPARSANGLAAWTALIGLVLWGLIHVAGGASLLLADVEAGLETLAPNAVDPVPARAGDAAAG